MMNKQIRRMIDEIFADMKMTADNLALRDEMMANACAMAVKNLLGLVCDPVGGLVEVPCVKRNVIGAMDALSAAQMALAGITSRVPPDQVLDAMREVGDALPHSLKETGKGGLAATPFGKQYAPEGEI